jgi:hypothetical protein
MAGRATSPTHAASAQHLLVEIGARHRIQPFHQGALDGLCPLYAALNALRLTLADHAPLSKADSKALFAQGIVYLYKKDWLADAVLEGMSLKRGRSLAQYLARQVSRTHCHVEIERADPSVGKSIDHVFAWVEESLRLSRPVMIALFGGLDHYTVAAGMTSKTLQFFDSCGHNFLRRSSCGLRSGFHQIPPNGLLRIAVHRSG